jgi:hypothetical protein
MICPECGVRFPDGFAVVNFIKLIVECAVFVTVIALMISGALALHDGYVKDFENRIKHPDEYRKQLQSDREWLERYEAAQP